MKTTGTEKRIGRGGFTVIELALTLSLMVGLASIFVFTSLEIDDWKLARNASLELRKVYVAQKTYLADHPTVALTTLTAEMLIPYLGSGATALPTLEGKDGETLTIKLDVMPPVVLAGGSVYDPSSCSDDGLWDVGGK